MTAQKTIHHELSSTLTLSDCRDGFWLYDTTRGMNIAIRAKTERAAFTDALEYYQDRTHELEQKLKTLQTAADAFILAVSPDDD